ncbi:hypothetical protein [Pyxidicoccus sp. MSG2]|uniref:hypothetical protein n=1 Tax=Pyxidicoccus sp. MSG2 TaxID=2996790 RepID=UPI0022707640|nr:hypothetical protein [Pyxidicoccus sp. MSG2]MCY1019987.1 hypothetical protein [Pyxidicoccus sp. MSG2]
MRLWLVVVCGVLVGCAGTPERRGRAEGYRLDSASAGCRQSPGLCTAAAGEEAVIPGARAAKVVATAAAAAVTAEVLRLFEEQRDALEQALTECADLARSKVLLELFSGSIPTAEQCKSEVERDAKGRPVTLAMKLGTEMHKVALACAQPKLARLRPGGFSLEPRYLYDPTTGKWSLTSREKEKSLLTDGPLSELKGSLKPDVVIHTDDPRRALAAYDFKFPCADITNIVLWTDYPSGPPHFGRNQEAAYMKALGLTDPPVRIQPRLGTIR